MDNDRDGNIFISLSIIFMILSFICGIFAIIPYTLPNFFEMVFLGTATGLFCFGLGIKE